MKINLQTMKTKVLMLLIALAATFSFVQAQKLPSKMEVLDKMVLANAYFMNK